MARECTSAPTPLAILEDLCGGGAMNHVNFAASALQHRTALVSSGFHMSDLASECNRVDNGTLYRDDDFARLVWSLRISCFRARLVRLLNPMSWVVKGIRIDTAHGKRAFKESQRVVVLFRRWAP